MAGQRKPVNYLNNRDLKKELEKSFAQNKMTEELGKMFMTLVDNVGKKSNYSQYSYLDEMKGLAIVTLCRGWNKFNMQYANPFAYFTTFVTNAFNHVLKLEKKEQNGRNAMMVDIGLNPSFSFSESDYENARGFSVNQKDDWAEESQNMENFDLYNVPAPEHDKIFENSEETVDNTEITTINHLD